MSRIAILSDIHANLPALEAVLEEVKAAAADQIIFLGDTVGYGASPAECVERVRKLGGRCVMGNHDIAIQAVRARSGMGRSAEWGDDGYLAGLGHAARSLDADSAAWLQSLPFLLRIDGAVTAHANLHEPDGFDYITDAFSAKPTLARLRRETHMTGFFGHTHQQRVFPDSHERIHWHDRTRFHIPADVPCAVMVGSVGQPRDGSDRRAAWVLWESEERIVEFRKTDYSRLQAARDIAEAGLPFESAVCLLDENEAAILSGW